MEATKPSSGESKTFAVEILRPTGTLSYKASVVAFPAQDGERAVLAHHAPFVCSVGMGILRICKENKQWESFFVDGGMMEMHENRLSFLSHKVSTAANIVRAEADKQLRTAQDRKVSAEYSRSQKNKDIRAAKLQLKLKDKSPA